MVIAGGTWADELEKWSDYPDRFTVAPYTLLNARSERNSPNFGTKKHPSYKLRDEFKEKFDAVIVDEAHYTKGRSTSWTWAVEQIAKRSGAVLEMSGTPMPNWAHELYTILRVLHPEEAKPGKRFGAYQRWVNTWFMRLNNPFGGGTPGSELIGGLLACGYDDSACRALPSNKPCIHYQHFVEANLGEKFLRRLRDDVLDLPPITQTQIKTPMDANALRMYKELKKEYVTSTADGDEVVAWTNGSKNVMLDRLTCSPWFLDPQGEPRGGKLDRLRFDLESRSAPTLVLAHYRDTVEACVRVAESTGARVGAVHGGISKDLKGKAVADFKQGRSDVLVGSLETLAEGLTLTVADMAIFVEQSYKPSRNEQALRRIHRMGQDKPVTVLDYMTPNTVDENKREVLAKKTDQQMRVMSAASFAALL